MYYLNKGGILGIACRSCKLKATRKNHYGALTKREIVSQTPKIYNFYTGELLKKEMI
jgi:hypothetical protein